MRVILSVCFSLCFLSALSQVNSVQSGDWDDPSTWNCNCVPTDGDSGPIIVSHNLIIDNDISLNEVVIANGGSVTVNPGATLTVVEDFSTTPIVIEAGGQLINNGTLDILNNAFFEGIVVNGTLESSSTIDFADPAVLVFNAGSTYRHNFFSGGDIPLATWDPNSTCEISGLDAGSPTSPGNLNQTFGNFTWNTPSLGSTLSLGGQLTSISGNLRLVNTNAKVVSFASGSSGYTLTIEGDVLVEGGIYFLTQNLSSSSEIIIEGNYTHTAGNVLLAQNNSNDITVQLAGNFSKTSGSFGAGSGTGLKNIVFNGDGTPQTYSTNALAANPQQHFRVAAGAHLDLGTSSIVTGTTAGAGSFTVESGGTVSLGSLNSDGAIQGNIPIATKNFDPGSTIIYNGAGPQFISFSIPAAVDVIIDNASGVSLAEDVTIGGNLVLTSGNLSVDEHTLTLGGTVTANGNSIVVLPTSSIVVNGSGAFGTFPFPGGAQTLANFTMNRNNGTVVFAQDVTINDVLTLSLGILDFTGVTLTLKGSISSSGGVFASSSGSSLILDEGDGAFGTLAFDPSGNVLGTLTLNRGSGTVELNSSLVVQSEFNLLAGTFTNTSGLRLGDGAVLTRNSGAALDGIPPTNNANERYSIRYTGGSPYTTGIELPTTTANDLLDLTIEGPVTLDKSIIVNGDLILSNSTLSGGSNITMAGQPGLWSVQGGTFDPGSGTVTISGDITIESPNTTPQFFNLTTLENSTLTLPSGIVNIRGNLQVNPDNSTLNANGGTIEFNGSGDQVVSGGNRDFNNITVNKSGGDLQFTSNVRLNGILDVATATVVEADGNLTVVSTSDGTSGNGSIGPLTSGGSITGNVTVQRYMSDEGRIYRYITSPVTNATVVQLQDDFYITGNFTGADTGCAGCTSNPSMFYYDEATPGTSEQGYFQFPISSNTETLQPGVGYVAFIRDNIIPGQVTFDVTGPINQGTVTLPITFTGSGNPGHDGYNLVGNPFPATINWNSTSGWTKQNIALPIAVRDNGSGTVRYWDGATGGLTNGNIAMGQAFWVRAGSDNPIPALSVNENAKVPATGEFFREKQGPVDVLQIVLSSNTVTDVAYFRYRSEATASLDNYDAPKLDNDRFDIATLSDDNIPMAINATNEIPCGNTIRLYVKDLDPGSYTLSTEAQGVFQGTKTTLIDSFTNTTVDFDVTPQYAFSVTSDPLSSAADRFSIILDGTPIDPNSITPSLADACEGENYQITLQGTQKGIYYFAEIDGKVVGDSVLSDGSQTITLSVPATELAMGANQVALHGYNYCTSVPLAANITINHDQIYAVTSSDVTGCADSEVLLEASGAPENGSYNWYEEEGSDTPIEGQHSSVFVTPPLAKPVTYYVAAVNAKGCEGPRIAVKANVVPYVPVQITEPEPGHFVSSYAEGNQWYLDGEIIAGATGNTYTATQSGTYSVEVDLGGCVTFTSVDFLVTGIDEVAHGRMFSPLENPFTDILRVQVKSSKPVDQISVYNALGSKVGDLRLTRSGNITEGEIDMTSSASGMYLVKTLLQDRVYTIKVLKR